MKLLEERILRDGRVLPGQVLKVSTFLNHQMDSVLISELGAEIGKRFADAGVTKILTVESSGIALAFAVGCALWVPVLFAKKHRTSNVSGNLYQTLVHSYTHGRDYTVVIERDCLCPGDKVLIVDDFLANGKAAEGLLDLIAQAGAVPVGAAFAVEKGFQDGGRTLREKGLRVESLAIIEKMDENEIIFREDN